MIRPNNSMVPFRPLELDAKWIALAGSNALALVIEPKYNSQTYGLIVYRTRPVYLYGECVA